MKDLEKVLDKLSSHIESSTLRYILDKIGISETAIKLEFNQIILMVIVALEDTDNLSEKDKDITQKYTMNGITLSFKLMEEMEIIPNFEIKKDDDEEINLQDFSGGEA